MKFNKPKPVQLAILSFVLWGILPIYWRQLHEVNSLEIIAQRMVWSLFFLGGFIIFTGRGRDFVDTISNLRASITLLCTGFLLALNWFLFIFGIHQGKVLECSLGYFLCPLMSAGLGIVVLGERLSLRKYLAIALACFAVAYKIYCYHSVPWLAFSIGGSFAVYGLVRKLITVDPVLGLTAESLFLTPFAISYLIFLYISGGLSLGHINHTVDILIISTGAVTALPLLLYSTAIRSLPLTQIGMLSYIGPTLQFFLAVFLFEEGLKSGDLVFFPLVWLALLIYTLNFATINFKPKNFHSA